MTVATVHCVCGKTEFIQIPPVVLLDLRCPFCPPRDEDDPKPSLRLIEGGKK